MEAREFELKPVINTSIYTSLIAQVVNISLKNFKFRGVNFSLGFKSKGRLFYGMQLSGADLEFKQNHDDYEKYYFTFNEKEKAEQDEYFYSFKIVTDFRDNDTLLAKVFYDAPQKKPTDCLFKISGIANAILFLIIAIFTHEPNDSLLMTALIFIGFIPSNVRGLVQALLIACFLNKKVSDLLIFCYLVISISNVHLFENAFLLVLCVLTQPKYLLIPILCIVSNLELSFTSTAVINWVIFIIYRKNDLKEERLLYPFVFFSIIIALIPFVMQNNIENEYNIKNSINVSIEPYSASVSYLKGAIKGIIEAADRNISFDKCRMCELTPIKKPNSTERDIIIVQAGKDQERALPALRSLRAVGCRAKIVAVLNPNEKISEKNAKAYEDCGIAVCNLEHDYSCIYFHWMNIVRFALFAEFFENCKGKYDRVFYCDTFDTVFQGDPFFEMKPNTLYASPENHPFWANTFLKSWFLRLPGFKYGVIKDRENICSGVFAADPETLIKLGELTKAMYKGTDFMTEDQAIYNFLIHMGVLKRLGVNVVPLQEYASIGFVINDWIDGFTKIGDIKSKSKGIVPSVVHQYNRNRRMDVMVAEKCGIPTPPLHRN